MDEPLSRTALLDKHYPSWRFFSTNIEDYNAVTPHITTCLLCGLAFSDVNCVRVHVASVHRPALVSSVNLPLGSVSPCPGAFGSSGQKSRGIKRVHRKEIPFLPGPEPLPVTTTTTSNSCANHIPEKKNDNDRVGDSDNIMTSETVVAGPSKIPKMSSIVVNTVNVQILPQDELTAEFNGSTEDEGTNSSEELNNTTL